MDTPSTAPVHEHSTSDFADQPEPESPTSTDGWGELENGIDEANEPDKDGWDDIEPLEEPKPSPALANIQAAQKRPVSQPALQPKQGRLSIQLAGKIWWEVDLRVEPLTQMSSNWSVNCKIYTWNFNKHACFLCHQNIYKG